VNVKAEKEVDLALKALERLAQSQGIKIDDLRDEFKKIVTSANLVTSPKP
jgi:hypothetical protein